MRSPEREYWIAGVHAELQILADLQVFALIPRSDIPRGRRRLKAQARRYWECRVLQGALRRKGLHSVVWHRLPGNDGPNRTP